MYPNNIKTVQSRKGKAPAFGCRHCDRIKDRLVEKGAEPKKVDRYLELFLPKKNSTKHELAALELCNKIDHSSEWTPFSSLKNVLEAVSHMTVCKPRKPN